MFLHEPMGAEQGESNFQFSTECFGLQLFNTPADSGPVTQRRAWTEHGRINAHQICIGAVLHPAQRKTTADLTRRHFE